MSWLKTFDSKQKARTAQKDEKLVLEKKLQKNADLHKPVLNTIMTTQE